VARGLHMLREGNALITPHKTRKDISDCHLDFSTQITLGLRRLFRILSFGSVNPKLILVFPEEVSERERGGKRYDDFFFFFFSYCRSGEGDQRSSYGP